MVRKHDIAIRFGGEEFIIILPRTDKLNGTIFAEKLLRAIKLYTFGN
ncbi:MAG TPA: diguanylate cyclase, partial [Candidatus Omnitrophica bacterium]|nr:diguanylate cyclase [Candidatus Omnitrophota bacterium]